MYLPNDQLWASSVKFLDGHESLFDKNPSLIVNLGLRKTPVRIQMGTNGPRWGWGFIKNKLSGPHYRDWITQCAQNPFYHFLPSCIPILLSISTNFSPSPLPPSSILRKRSVFLILSEVARRNLPGIRCSRMLPIPPQVDSQSAHNQLTKTRICDVVHLKKK